MSHCRLADDHRHYNADDDFDVDLSLSQDGTQIYGVFFIYGKKALPF